MKVVHLCMSRCRPGHPDHARLVLHPGRLVQNLAVAETAHTSLDPERFMQVPGASRRITGNILHRDWGTAHHPRSRHLTQCSPPLWDAVGPVSRTAM
jgi:hypothetical protein